MSSVDGAAYFDGLNEKLLAAIPRDARNIIEFGCANGRLGEAFKKRVHAARWSGVDINEGALARAAPRLDSTFLLDVERDEFVDLDRNYDCVVFGDLLEHLSDPETFLRKIQSITTSDARLVCCVPNMGHASVIERMLMGDIAYDESGLLDASHIRFLSVASVYKLLLDAGWLPNLVDSYVVGHDERYIKSLANAGEALGIPFDSVIRNICTY